jgi:hypothetical protein
MKLSWVTIIVSLIAVWASRSEDKFIPITDFTLNGEQTVILTSAGGDLKALAKKADSKLGELQREDQRVDLNVLAEKLRPFYQEYMDQAVQIVASSQERFDKFTTKEEQQRASKIFFGDISYQYTGVKNEVGRMTGPQLEKVKRLVPLVLADSGNVFALAAEKGSLLFDLLVDSTPQGAEISLKRAPDSDFSDTRQLTKDTIRGLARAQWLVRARLNGYEDGQKWFNAWTDTSDSIHLDLVKSGKKDRGE